MPLKGRQRTKHQKAHTAMMQKQRWLPKSPARAKAVDPTTRCLISSMEKKHKREMEKVKKAIEAQPPFALLCRCRLTFVALALIVDFYSQPLILHIFFNENLCATHYSYRSVHPAHPTRNIRNVQFIIADAIRKWVLAGTNKCKQLRSHLVALPIPNTTLRTVACHTVHCHA